MRKSVWLFLAFSALTIACGDDDANPATPKPDSGTPNPNPNGDAGADTGAPACTFAGYVINLVNTQTTASAVPTADLGDKCTPSTSQDDFKPLFP